MEASATFAEVPASEVPVAPILKRFRNPELSARCAAVTSATGGG